MTMIFAPKLFWSGEVSGCAETRTWCVHTPDAKGSGGRECPIFCVRGQLVSSFG